MSNNDEKTYSRVELELVKIVGKVEGIDNQCKKMGEQIEHELAWKHHLVIYEEKIQQLTDSVSKLQASQTWLIRTIGGALVLAVLSTLAGVIK